MEFKRERPETQRCMQVNRLFIFPIKSLDSVELESVRITEGGTLEGDRRYAILDREGKFVNGKRDPRLIPLRSTYDENFREVRIMPPGHSRPEHFCLEEPSLFNRWMSEYLGFHVELHSNRVQGFPDDLEAYGPTIVSEQSLYEIAQWFPPLTVEDTRRRFRANIELRATDAFEEDRLFGGPEERIGFCLGDIAFLGHNPCQRCAVPSRDLDTGEVLPGFQKRFMEFRKQRLNAYSDPRRFNHYYRFAVNTSIPLSETGKIIRLADPIRL